MCSRSGEQPVQTETGERKYERTSGGKKKEINGFLNHIRLFGDINNI